MLYRPLPLLKLLILISFSFSVASEEKSDDWNLMLAGGSLNTCSSMSLGRCKNDQWVDKETMRVDTMIEIDSAGIERIINHPIWAEHRQDTRAQLAQALQRLQGQHQAPIPLADFSRTLRRVYPNLWRELLDTEWFLVRDALSLPLQPNVQEMVNLSASSEPAGAALFQRFSDRARELAEGETPRIVVVTASARDSFDAVDFYRNAFKDTGAIVEWLPIDAATSIAAAQKSCEKIDKIRESSQVSFYQARKSEALSLAQKYACENPESLVSSIENAHGLFINGGDQSLTRQAFYTPEGEPTAWLLALQQRVASGSMIAGGTSAGTAIMPLANMISNGSSETALRHGAIASPPPPTDCERLDTCPNQLTPDSLTYEPRGGIGLFPFGLLDTHFSERGRQARLMRLAADTDTPLAVGVDETTALLVNTQTGDFEVAGAYGVFMIEQVQHGNASVAGYFHYLRHGTQGRLSSSGVQQIAFSPNAAQDRGAAGEGLFLRDRTITAALQRCQRDPLLQLSRDGFIALLRTTEHSQLAHAESGCEISFGAIAFSWPES